MASSAILNFDKMQITQSRAEVHLRNLARIWPAATGNRTCDQNWQWWWPFWILFNAHNLVAIQAICRKFGIETENEILETELLPTNPTWRRPPYLIFPQNAVTQPSIEVNSQNLVQILTAITGNRSGDQNIPEVNWRWWWQPLWISFNAHNLGYQNYSHKIWQLCRQHLLLKNPRWRRPPFWSSTKHNHWLIYICEIWQQYEQLRS